MLRNSKKLFEYDNIKETKTRYKKHYLHCFFNAEDAKKSAESRKGNKSDLNSLQIARYLTSLKDEVFFLCGPLRKISATFALSIKNQISSVISAYISDLLAKCDGNMRLSVSSRSPMADLLKVLIKRMRLHRHYLFILRWDYKSSL